MTLSSLRAAGGTDRSVDRFIDGFAARMARVRFAAFVSGESPFWNCYAMWTVFWSSESTPTRDIPVAATRSSSTALDPWREKPIKKP